MKLIYKRCAGIDVHKDTVVVCVRKVNRGKVNTEVRTFGTTTRELFELADWLESERCTHAAMESTGVYWKPVWHVVAERVELILANASDVKNLPGRKTDVNDATWLAELLAHGLIRASFVPERPIQELRDLTRTRKQLVRQHTQYVQRIQKVLEGANLKLASFISDVMGQSGRRILQAIIDGETDPNKLAALASTRIKASQQELTEALRGYITPHHRFMLRLHLSQVDGTNAALSAIEAQANELIRPFCDAVTLVKTTPGVSDTAAHTVVSEIGCDMSRFPTADHLVSWAGLCPRSDVSAGKRRSTRIRHGNPWLKTMLVQAAWAAVRTRESYERALYYRICHRGGPKKAIVAVAASLLRAIYHMLRDHVPYRSLGPDHFNQLDVEKAKTRHIKALQRLGFDVSLTEAA